MKKRGRDELLLRRFFLFALGFNGIAAIHAATQGEVAWVVILLSNTVMAGVFAHFLRRADRLNTRSRTNDRPGA